MEEALAPMASATATTVLVLLFLRAAFHKAADFGGFTGFVADYRLVPEPLVEPVARGLVGLEALAVALLVWPATVRFGAMLAILLLGLYAAGIAINVARGRTRVECGCGGAAQRLSLALVLRNALLAAPALLPASLGAAHLTLAEAVAAVASGLLLFLAYTVVEQILANDGHLRLTR